MALRFRNLDLDSFESELKNKSGRKGPRVRQSKSCLECRTRRKRCSREQPCKECHQRGAPSECVYISTPRYTRPIADPLPSPPDASDIHASPDDEVSPHPMGHETEMESDTNTGQGDEATSRPRRSPPPTTSSKPLGAGSVFQSTGLKTRMIGLSHWMAPCREMLVIKAFLDHSDDFESAWSAFGELKPLLAACNSIPPSPSLLGQASDGTSLRFLLPDRVQCEEWVNKFCQSYNRIYGIVHAAALGEDVRQFYAGTLNDPIHVARVVLVLAIAMQDSEAYRMHGRMLAREIEDCINSSSRFQKPCIGVVQNLLLLLLLKTISASDTDKMLDMLSLQGLTGQILFNMGLHRDPAPFPGITPYYAELRKRLWACYLRLSLDFCMRSGTRLNISLDETDCPLPTAIILDSLDGPHKDGTAFDEKRTDTDFIVAAVELASIIAPVYRKLYLPKPPNLVDLQNELRPSFEAFMTSLPLSLRPETSATDPILELQRSILSISMQSSLSIITLGFTLSTPPNPNQRTNLMETWDLASSITHQFQRTCQSHPSLHNIAHHLLWPDVNRAALTACWIVGRLRSLDHSRPLSLNPRRTLRVFHKLLDETLSFLSQFLHERSHLGPIAAKVNLIVAIALSVTRGLFSDDCTPTSVTPSLSSMGVRTAERQIAEMKSTLLQRRISATPPTTTMTGGAFVSTPATLSPWGVGTATSLSPTGTGGMDSAFLSQDFLSHDAMFGSLLPDFCFMSDEGMNRFSSCPLGGTSLESLWE